jgi:ABC-type dipeptide/oligopeptide/nickel transport system permease subunit
MNGWTAAFIAVLILAIAGITLGLFALYQKRKEEVKNT